VRLGLSAETYRWVAFPWMRADLLAYRSTGRTLPYFTTPSPPETLELPIDWMLERVREHGLASLSMESGWFEDERRAAAFKLRTEELGIVYFASVSADLAAPEDEWGARDYVAGQPGPTAPVYDPAVATPLRTGWTGGAHFDVVVRAMELAAAAGARLVSIVHGHPDRPNRFTKTPPVGEQIDRMIQNLRSLMPVAESMGLVLTNEAHMDYACADLATVLEAVDSPWLRHTFDFGDPVAVNEDPLEAVRRVAKYTIATHIKDVHLTPLTEIALGAVFHTPIGSGDVPVERILEVLAVEAPDAGSLHHCIEVTPRPDQDVGRWVEASMDWLHEHCSRFWTE
jgi:sugar phosphate isomerase/epimerase